MSTTPKYSYRNITISGLPGSGSTTLLKGLKEELTPQGWQGFSGGEFMRMYAEAKGIFQPQGGLHHDASHYEDDFDRQVDFGMRDKLTQETNWVIESWLSGFLAQGVPGVLKVLMTCSDDAVRIDRIVNRDKVDVQTAKNNIHSRMDNNFTKWKRLYADQWSEWVVGSKKATADEPIYFWKPELYDLVIDTYSTNQAAALKLVLDAINKKS